MNKQKEKNTWRGGHWGFKETQDELKQYFEVEKARGKMLNNFRAKGFEI